MKTTVELPDSLVAEAREIAHQGGTSLRELLTAGLRTELERRRSGAAGRRFHFPAAGGTGLKPGVDPRALHEHAYDLSPGE